MSSNPVFAALIMKKTKEEIAREAIASAAESWDDSPEAVKSEVDGELVFTFYAHSGRGTSTFVFNPLPVVLNIIKELEGQGTPLEDEEENERNIELHAADATSWLLQVIAKKHFETFLEELPLLTVTAKSASILDHFGAKKKREEEIEEMVQTFSDRL